MESKDIAKKPYWTCSCGFATNWNWKTGCHACGKRVPASHVVALAERLSGPQVKAKPRAKPKAKAKAKADGEVSNAAMDKLTKANEALLARIKALEKDVVDKADTDMVVDASAVQEIVDKQKEVRTRLNDLRALPDSMRKDLFPKSDGTTYEGAVAAAEAELVATGQLRRAAKPLKDQVTSQEAWLKGAEARDKKAAESLKLFEQELADVQAQTTDAREAAAKTANAVVEGKRHLASLNALLAQEQGRSVGVQPLAGVPGAVPSAAEAAIRTLFNAAAHEEMQQALLAQGLSPEGQAAITGALAALRAHAPTLAGGAVEHPIGQAGTATPGDPVAAPPATGVAGTQPTPGAAQPAAPSQQPTPPAGWSAVASGATALGEAALAGHFNDQDLIDDGFDSPAGRPKGGKEGKSKGWSPEPAAERERSPRRSASRRVDSGALLRERLDANTLTEEQLHAIYAVCLEDSEYQKICKEAGWGFPKPARAKAQS